MSAIQAIPVKPSYREAPGFFARLFGRQPRFNAAADARGLVASGDLSAATLANLSEAYGFDVVAAFPDDWRMMLHEAAKYLTSDGRLDADELDTLRALARLFRIPADDAQRTYQAAVSEVLARMAVDMVDDGGLSTEEWDRFDAVRTRCGLPAQAGADAYGVAVKAYMDALLNRINDDGLVSDSEYEEYFETCRRLKAQVANKHELDRAMEFGRARWRAVCGPLESCETDIRLQRGEVCHYYATADWYETRKVRQRVDYAGFAGRVRIVKGLSFRYGSIGYRAPSVDQLTLTGTGTLLLTSKRLLFMPRSGNNRSIPWRSVLGINVNSLNEFEVEKSAGKSPVIDVKSATFGHPLIAPFIAQRLLANAA